MRSIVRGLGVSKRGVDASNNQCQWRFGLNLGVPRVAQLLHYWTDLMGTNPSTDTVKVDE